VTSPGLMPTALMLYVVSATTAKLVMPRPANAPMVAKMVGLVNCVMNQFVMTLIAERAEHASRQTNVFAATFMPVKILSTLKRMVAIHFVPTV